MTAQRYVFRYAAHSPEYYRPISDARVRRGLTSFDIEEAAAKWNANFAGTYEKEGGGFTRDLQEAKVIGWRSAKRWAKEPLRGELVPIEIVIQGD